MSASGLRNGSEPIMFPFAPLVRSQALAPFSIKLLEEAPFNDIPPLLTQSPPLVLFAIITFFRVGLLPIPVLNIPPQLVPAELPLKVTFVKEGLDTLL